VPSYQPPQLCTYHYPLPESESEFPSYPHYPQQEGAVAFTKGWTGRVLRVAPTMAITLLVYEQLQCAFGVSEAPVLGPFL